jgi:hypothetical protein
MQAHVMYRKSQITSQTLSHHNYLQLYAKTTLQLDIFSFD